MPSRSSPQRQTRPSPPPETVDPRWLLQAFLAVVGVALLCGYLTLCLLFYRGQWQLVLHPGNEPLAPTPTGAQIVHFGPDATATPQLTGWWIPAAPDAPYRRLTFLYLRSGDGTLNDDLPTLAALHNFGVNLLAFNYRGYPATGGQHPSEEHMREDTAAAFQYLLADRHLPPDAIVPYGVGIGASLALQLASEHHEIPALILDSPDGDLLSQALHAPSGSFVPVRLLFHERFPLADPLRKLATPKLIVSRTGSEAALTQRAADPKFTVELPPGSPGAALAPSLERFLDQYLPPPALSEINGTTLPLPRTLREPLK